MFLINTRKVGVEQYQFGKWKLSIYYACRSTYLINLPTVFWLIRPIFVIRSLIAIERCTYKKKKTIVKRTINWTQTQVYKKIYHLIYLALFNDIISVKHLRSPLNRKKTRTAKYVIYAQAPSISNYRRTRKMHKVVSSFLLFLR